MTDQTGHRFRRLGSRSEADPTDDETALRGECFSILRETLNRLASDGFVEATPQRIFVKPVSKQDILEIGGLRTLLECHALKESIQHGDSEWEGKLVSAYHKPEEAKICVALEAGSFI